MAHPKLQPIELPNAGLGVLDLGQDLAWAQLSGRLDQHLAHALRRAKARGEAPQRLTLRLETEQGVAIREIHLQAPSLRLDRWRAAALGALRLAWAEVPPGTLRLRLSFSAKSHGPKVVSIRSHQARRWPAWRRWWVGAKDGLHQLKTSWWAPA